MANDRTSILREPSSSTGYNVAFTGTAGSTSNFTVGPSSVMVWSTSDCYVNVGEDITATTADTPMPAYTPMFLPVPQGSGAPWRVSAIQISSAGTIYAKAFS
jgi:hypothetical protein